MNILLHLSCLLLLWNVLAAPACAAARPNIIFILSDDLAMGDLGCYGQKLIKTPHLDRMAREGTRYTQAYCGTTVCAPSRASLMTGLHSYDGRTVPLQAGMTVRIPAQVGHNMVNTGTETLRTLVSFSTGDRKTVFLEEKPTK